MELADDETRAELLRQFRLVLAWLIGSLACAFLLALCLDVGIILCGPIAAFISAVFLIGLVVRGGVAAWRLRDRHGYALLAASIAVMGAGLFAVTVQSILRAGNYLQPLTILMSNKSAYDRVVAEPDHNGDKSVDYLGTGPKRLVLFNYGGWLSIDRDIVSDPADRPDQRIMAAKHATAVDCDNLRGHHYDYTLDY